MQRLKEQTLPIQRQKDLAVSLAYFDSIYIYSSAIWHRVSILEIKDYYLNNAFSFIYLLQGFRLATIAEIKFKHWRACEQLAPTQRTSSFQKIRN